MRPTLSLDNLEHLVVSPVVFPEYQLASRFHNALIDVQHQVVAHAPESISVRYPDSTMILTISYHLQFSLVALHDFSEGSAPRLQASVLVQAPQLPITTSPVGKDKSILMGLYHQPVGGSDEVPFGVVLLVAVCLVVVGAGGGLEGGVLHQTLAGEGKGEEASGVRGRQQGGVEHHRGLANEIVAGESVLVPHLHLQINSCLRRFHREGEGALGWVVDWVLVVLPYFRLLLVPTTNDLNIRIALPHAILIRQVRCTEHPDHKGFASHSGNEGNQGDGFGSHPASPVFFSCRSESSNK